MMEASVKIMPILAKDPNDGAYGTDLTQGLKCKV
jgi:hypothetical protein